MVVAAPKLAKKCNFFRNMILRFVATSPEVSLNLFTKHFRENIIVFLGDISVGMALSHTCHAFFCFLFYLVQAQTQTNPETRKNSTWIGQSL